MGLFPYLRWSAFQLPAYFLPFLLLSLCWADPPNSCFCPLKIRVCFSPLEICVCQSICEPHRYTHFLTHTHTYTHTHTHNTHNYASKHTFLTLWLSSTRLPTVWWCGGSRWIRNTRMTPRQAGLPSGWGYKGTNSQWHVGLLVCLHVLLCVFACPALCVWVNNLRKSRAALWSSTPSSHLSKTLGHKS